MQRGGTGCFTEHAASFTLLKNTRAHSPIPWKAVLRPRGGEKARSSRRRGQNASLSKLLKNVSFADCHAAKAHMFGLQRQVEEAYS